MQAALDAWAGVDVSVGEIEAELARLRDVAADGGTPRQRTSVMTHVAWVPPEWLGAAERTLEGMAERHPSRTLILVPEQAGESRIDAELSVRCFRAGDREICGEVIELHLLGDRVRAPVSIVVPLAIADLPLSLRWRGEPAFAETQWTQLVELADRVIVDSAEWGALRYGELAASFERTVVSDIAWARGHAWRVALAACWPAIREQRIEVSGPPAEAALIAGWLSARLERALEPPRAGARLTVALDGQEVAPDGERPTSPSDLLSAELDRRAREAIYEEAVRRLAAGGVADWDV